MSKKAVIYGAGNIGRGLVGQLFYESGYESVFIDIDKALIEQLNAIGEYPIKFTDGGEIIVKNVSGIDGSAENIEQVAEVIAQADIMAISVGANVLKHIMQPIAIGINKRLAASTHAFNIILCENLIGVGKIMRDGVREYISEDLRAAYDEKIGFAEASVGRTVPNQTDEMKSGNPLRIVAESYSHLPVDKDGFRGEIPDIEHMTSYSPFEYFIRRKLYLHNMAHALCAYLGDIAGYEYIWQAIRDPYIELIVSKTMQRSAFALSKLYSADMRELSEYIENLIHRFGDKALGDTVKRVGNDLKRKLSPTDRIMGARMICLETGVSTDYICLAIAAAANFKGDKLSGSALEDILREATSLDLLNNSEDYALVQQYDKLIKSGASMQELYEAVES